MGIVNRIGEAEQERLGLFTEECGEANQIVGKILRHGIDSSNPLEACSVPNGQLLELEAGHVLAAINLLVACGTLSLEGLERARVAKLVKLRSWLHCGTNLDAIDELLHLTFVGAGSVRLYGTSQENAKEAETHAAGGCDAPNIAVAKDGTMYCARCGWNDTKAWPEYRPEPRHAEGGE